MKRIFCISLMIYVLVFMISLRSRKSHPKLIKSAPLQLQYVVVHFDLKGAPPYLSYLESLLPQLKLAGVNALLMEYEDMFPYEGNLETLRSKNCYNASELMNFLTNATRSGFEIIPLVQTFGHLEFALKHKEFVHLREDPSHADSMCPSKAGSLPLVREIVKQITEFHNVITPLKHIHVGCDEVFFMNKCEDCKARNVSNVEIFRSHVKAVCGMVTSLSPGTKTLIWDDMLRGNHPELLSEIQLPIEPIAWHYSYKSVITHTDAYKYHKNFGTFWAASAFKGTDNIYSIIPNLQARFDNHYIWMKFVRTYSKLFPLSTRSNFRGIILTGWSRFNHFSAICDLLPVSIPSLFTNLYFINSLKTENYIDLTSPSNTVFANYVWPKLTKTLKCNTVNKVDSVNNFDASNCHFEGVKLYKVVKQISALYTKINKFLSNIKTQKFIEESSKSKAKREAYNYLEVFLKANRKMKLVMAPYYTPSIIHEYVTYMSQDMIRRLTRVATTNSPFLPQQ